TVHRCVDSRDVRFQQKWRASVRFLIDRKNELRDPESERPGSYAVDMAGLVYMAEGGDDYNGAEAWVAVDPDGQ
ncbi:hypothetical protein ALQ42_05044, partial [Pseudomonas savastanoi pv. glycinea]